MTEDPKSPGAAVTADLISGSYVVAEPDQMLEGAGKEANHDVQLPEVTPFATGTRMSYRENLDKALLLRLIEVWKTTAGSVVIDFAGHGGVSITGLAVLAQFSVKVLKPAHRAIYLLHLPKDGAKLVHAQGLATMLHVVEKPEQVPGLPTEHAPKLDLKFVNLFIDSTVETLHVQCKVKAAAQKPFLSNTRAPVYGDVLGLLTITCEYFNGVIALLLPAETFLFAMGQMVGDTFTEITDEVRAVQQNFSISSTATPNMDSISRAIICKKQFPV